MQWVARRGGHDGFTLTGEERICQREGLLVAWDAGERPPGSKGKQPELRGQWGVVLYEWTLHGCHWFRSEIAWLAEMKCEWIGWEFGLQGGVRWSRNDKGARPDLHGPMGSEDRVFWMQMGKPILSH